LNKDIVHSLISHVRPIRWSLNQFSSERFNFKVTAFLSFFKARVTFTLLSYLIFEFPVRFRHSLSVDLASAVSIANLVAILQRKRLKFDIRPPYLNLTEPQQR